eukprot:scaffold68432_cov26-Tisochrysis_lutea.AAC.1
MGSTPVTRKHVIALDGCSQAATPPFTACACRYKNRIAISLRSVTAICGATAWRFDNHWMVIIHDTTPTLEAPQNRLVDAKKVSELPGIRMLSNRNC